MCVLISLKFLTFHPNHADLADRVVCAVADHATPVGSGMLPGRSESPSSSVAERWRLPRRASTILGAGRRGSCYRPSFPESSGPLPSRPSGSRGAVPPAKEATYPALGDLYRGRLGKGELLVFTKLDSNTRPLAESALLRLIKNLVPSQPFYAARSRLELTLRRDAQGRRYVLTALNSDLQAPAEDESASASRSGRPWTSRSAWNCPCIGTARSTFCRWPFRPAKAW